MDPDPAAPASAEHVDPDAASAELESFWVLARRQARLESLPGYFGPTVIGSVVPPAWAFGSDAAMADELLALVLEGTKTATASAAEDYEAEGERLPEQGDLAILLDGEGHPRALIAVTEVAVVPFGEVSAEHARLEGEGDRSLEQWRRDHERFFTEQDPTGRGFRPDMPVVLERFRLLHPVPAR